MDADDKWPNLPRLKGKDVVIPAGWLDSLQAIEMTCKHFCKPFSKVDVHVHWMENAKRFISLYHEGWVFSIPANEFRVQENGMSIGSVVLVNAAMLRQVHIDTPKMELFTKPRS